MADDPKAEKPNCWAVMDKRGNTHSIDTPCFAVWGAGDMLQFSIIPEEGDEQPVAFFHQPTYARRKEQPDG